MCVGISHELSVWLLCNRAFRAKYAKDSRKAKTIRAWYKQFTVTGWVCKRKAPVLTLVWQELAYRIDVCRVTGGAHVEHHLWLSKKKKAFSVSL